MRVWRALVPISLAAVLLAACGDSKDPQRCVRRGSARVCLVGLPPVLRVEGHGLRPRSAVEVEFPPGTLAVNSETVDAAGNFPSHSQVGLVMGQAKRLNVRLAATTGDGQPFTATFRVTRYAVEIEAVEPN